MARWPLSRSTFGTALANPIDRSNIPVPQSPQLTRVIALVEARRHKVMNHPRKQLTVMMTISADSPRIQTTSAYLSPLSAWEAVSHGESRHDSRMPALACDDVNVVP
jgi:hypothetical protein